MRSLRVVFRVDASLQMGTGHVMRCLTLADALTARGAECQFISRMHPGNLLEKVRSKGYVAHALAAGPKSTALGEYSLAHSHWLGATQAEDAAACAPILARLQPDWLIVDHYALDARWERASKLYYRKLMVIDDLADRSHECDLLLDQTFGRDAADYRAFVPTDCMVLCGSQYALLRPEFAALRLRSLQRRTEPRLQHLLISMGGVDQDNATGKVMRALRSSSLPFGSRITVVMGATAPWLAEVEQLAQRMPWMTRVRVDVSEMAQLMADADLAIGAAGATSWERCCLGLPTAMVVLAVNQLYAADVLERAGAVRMLQMDAQFAEELHQFVRDVTDSVTYLKDLVASSSEITDGRGCLRLIEALLCKGSE